MRDDANLDVHRSRSGLSIIMVSQMYLFKLCKWTCCDTEYNSPYREHQGQDSYNPCRANRHRSCLPDSFGSASDDLESGAGLAATHFTAQPGTISHQNIPLTSRQFTVESALAQSRSKLSATAPLPNSNNDEVAQHEWSSNPIENTMARGVRETHQSILLCQRSPPCGNSPPSDKNRKVHKMCARYCEILDVKFRRELGFEPIVNWFDPAPVLSAIMLPPPI